MNFTDPKSTGQTRRSLRRVIPIVLTIAALGFVAFLYVDLPTDMAAKRAYRDVQETLHSDILTTETEIRDLLQLEPSYAGQSGEYPFNEEYKFVGIRKEYTLHVYYRVLDNSMKQLAAVELKSKNTL